jgi:hypothetical protein
MMLPLGDPSGAFAAEDASPHPVLDRCCFTCPTRGYRLECLAGLGENRQVARRGFIAAYDHIDVQRIEFDASAHTLGLLGGNESRAGAEKWINDDIAAIGEVEERVLEHGGRLDGRVVL